MNLFKPEIPFPAKVLSVNDLTKHLKGLLENDRLLSAVWVQGEISNLVKAASGHCYFTLKDDQAVIKAALWASSRRKIAVDFKNGDFVMVFGGLSVYAPRGEYQITVQDLRPAGIGALYEAFEKLKKKLQAEGLFEPERKMPLPVLPRGIGVVTSPRGAVIQDIFRVIRRRFQNMPIFLVPVKVQGEGAAAEIVAGITRLNNEPRVDVIIVARGGGSLEDLWAFNEEVVARAISASTKPVVSAVGHETDTTIADMVADRRAATPSVAGELVVPVKAELLNLIARQKKRLEHSMRGMLLVQRQRYRRAASCRFLVKPSLLVVERRTRIMNLVRELESLYKRFFDRKVHRLSLLSARLVSLNPMALLNRGYSMVTDLDGRVVNSVNLLQNQQKLCLHFADGQAGVSVNELKTNQRGDNDATH
ncbi:MAG TPA: exodeoxyribonuclease VII large subunit [Candidatus Rifleibacterium sp.]|nr:exodeoxyribonuclease VII large subunit [Candidatus Rifleibacterium sp.]HPT47339.1 exodeoxyribonuclease VII large subunit [Candidatus Rifleibacterium sp.]